MSHNKLTERSFILGYMPNQVSCELSFHKLSFAHQGHLLILEFISDKLPDFNQHKNILDYKTKWKKKKESFKKPFKLKSYEEIVTFPNLYRAYKKARARKSSKKEVMEFENNLVENLWTLHDKLIRKDWDDIFVYHRFYIKRPKPRTIDALTFEGRIVQHLLCDNGIAEWFDRRLVKECAACRKYLGTHYAAKMAKDHLHRFYLKHGINGYILKIDIRKFFENIDHEVLKGKISKVEDESIREFLYYIIDHTPEPKGLPIGNQTSQWFALYYLDTLDRIIKEKYRCQYYVRYMDDLIIIHESKEFLQKLLKDLTLEAKNTLHIEFNRKTQITKLKEGFTFVGWRFSLNQSGKVTVKLTSAKRKDINHKAKESLYQYRNGLISQNKHNEKITSMLAYMYSMNKNRGKIAPELIIIELSPQSLTQE